MRLATLKHLLPTLLVLLLPRVVFADCNNSERQKCGYNSHVECVTANNIACPPNCAIHGWCIPDNDCMVAGTQMCTFSCCPFKDRGGCERCAEIAGMSASDICDATGCPEDPREISKPGEKRGSEWRA